MWVAAADSEWESDESCLKSFLSLSMVTVRVLVKRVDAFALLGRTVRMRRDGADAGIRQYVEIKRRSVRDVIRTSRMARPFVAVRIEVDTQGARKRCHNVTPLLCVKSVDNRSLSRV